MFRLLKALPVTLALAALSIFATSCGSSSSAKARFVNAIQNTANYGGSLDVEVNTTKEFSNVVFPNVSASTYTSVPSGSDTIQGFVAGGTTTSVFSDTTSLSSGSQYTLVATGFAGGSGGNVVLLSLSDNNAAPASGNVAFRVIDASPSQGAVDVYIIPNPVSGPEGTPAISGLAYTQGSAYVPLAFTSGETYQMFVTVSGNTEIIFSQTLSPGNTGAIRTLVLTDVANGTTMNQLATVLSDLN